MVNKTVISVNMKCNECKKVVWKCFKEICGINSIEFNMKDRTIIVLGEADPVCMTKQLRRKFKCAYLVSHDPVPQDPPKPPPKTKVDKKYKDSSTQTKDPCEDKKKTKTKDPPPSCCCQCSPCYCRCKLPPPTPPPCGCGWSPCSCRWKSTAPPPPPPLLLPPACGCGWSPCSCRRENFPYDFYVVKEEIPPCTIC